MDRLTLLTTSDAAEAFVILLRKADDIKGFKVYTVDLTTMAKIRVFLFVLQLPAMTNFLIFQPALVTKQFPCFFTALPSSDFNLHSHFRGPHPLKPHFNERSKPSLSMGPSRNRFTRNQHNLPATKEDFEIFRDIVRKVGSAAPEEAPSIIGSHVDFLLTRNIAELAKQAKQDCDTPLEGAKLDIALETVLNFLEEFVSMAKGMAADNKSLLREILQAASSGMDALDAKIADIVSGSAPLSFRLLPRSKPKTRPANPHRSAHQGAGRCTRPPARRPDPRCFGTGPRGRSRTTGSRR